MKSDLDTLKVLINHAIKRGLFPGAALSVAEGRNTIIQEYFGRETFVPWSRAIEKDSYFDLASLTKPLGTALAVAALVSSEMLRLDEPLARFFEKTPTDKADITIRHLLCHSSGLGPHEMFYEHMGLESKDRKAVDRVCRQILLSPCIYETGTGSVYSDLDFVLLGRIVEKAAGCALLSFLRDEIYAPMGINAMEWQGSDSFSLEKAVPTGWCPIRRRLLKGEVNDMNAWLLGGIAGHAGLFATLESVHRLILKLLDCFAGRGSEGMPISTPVLREFFTPQKVCRSGRWALGFDTPNDQGSSAGDFFSRKSVGHLGYTGTSFWIDIDKLISVVFLSNRTFPFDKEEEKLEMKRFRRVLHNQVMSCLGFDVIRPPVS
jgi:CubicO group peptidase (beta-lactamase class C family)